MKYLPYAKICKSPNHGGVLKDPTVIVVHYTAGGSLDGATKWLCSKAAKASAHLIIDRDGKHINQLLPLDVVGWHAGNSTWRGRDGVNSFSIGIELVNYGPAVMGEDGRFRSPTNGAVIGRGDLVEAHHKNGGAWKTWQIYPATQLKALEGVCRDIVKIYPSITECVGHDDVSPGRKWDPGPAMDMSHLNSAVFGRA